LKHDPRHSEAHYNLANLYFEVNDFRLAQIHYEIAVEVEPTFANVYFNLALVQSINHELAAAIKTLTTYQELVPADEARNADELLRNLRQSLAASKDPQLGS
jgi:tetratricopeptide (TPR) repeat protein